ncbi:hypothetical protein Tco_1235673 [Tanacetum coccineum]
MLRPLGSEDGPLTGPSMGPSTGLSRRRPRVFEEKVEGFKEKARGLLRTQQRLDSVSVLGEGWQFPCGCKVAKKAKIKASGCYKGYMLLRRLPCYRDGCHIVGRLLQRLHAVVKVATEVDGCYRGCHIGPTDGATDCAKRGTYQAPMVTKEVAKILPKPQRYKSCENILSVASLLDFKDSRDDEEDNKELSKALTVKNKGPLPLKPKNGMKDKVSSDDNEWWKKPILLPSDSGSQGNMTGVKSYLHNMWNNQDLKWCLEDDSTCTTEGYGSTIKCNGKNFTRLSEKRGNNLQLQHRIEMICPR